MSGSGWRSSVLRPGGPVTCTCQRGQAVVEMAVLLAVLLPMIVMVPVMAKIADVNHTTIQAARYVAWERTVAPPRVKSGRRLRREVRVRFFNLRDAAITDDLEDRRSEQDPKWYLVGGPGRHVVVSSDVKTRIDEQPAPGRVAGAVDAVVGRLSEAVAGLGADVSWDLDSDGLFVGRVSADVLASMPFYDVVGRRPDCRGRSQERVFACITQSSAILADGWGASSPEQAARRVKAFVPTALLGFVRHLNEKVGRLGIDLTQWTDLARFEPGFVNTEVVPSDRLERFEP